MRRLIVVVLVTLLALTGCVSVSGKDGESKPRGGVDVRQGGVRVSAAAGAVPKGSALAVGRGDTPNPVARSGVAGLRPLGQAVKITIDGGRVQPRSPLTVAVRVGSRPSSASRVGFILQGEGAAPEFILGKYDDGSSSVVAEVPHLSWVWPVQIDVAKILRDAMDYVLQSTGLTSARPGCAGNKPVVGGRQYSVVVQPAQAWVCLKREGSALSVEVSANSPVPFRVESAPHASSFSFVTDLGNQSTVGTALVRGLGFDPAAGLIAAGVGTRLRYANPASTRLTFGEEPVMLLAQLLIGVLEPILDAKNIVTLSKAKCFRDVVQAAGNDSFTVKAAADLTVAFFSCVGEVVQLSAVGAVVVAMISAVPQAFAGSFIGLVEEFTGEGKFSANIEAGPAPKVTSGDVGPLAVGQTAHLPYFDVTVDGHRLDSLWGAHVRVCYTHPHPSAAPDGTTRVSTDPWQFGFGQGADRRFDREPTIDTRISDYWKPAYGEAKLRLGQCHAGWVTVQLVEEVGGFSGMRYAPKDFGFTATWQW